MINSLNSLCNLSSEDFFDIIENMYDEIIVYDDNYRIVYLNKASQRHYGCSPNQMIGKSFFDMIDKEWWDESILPIVYEEKKSYAIKQKTFIGCDLLTVAVPIFDEKNEIKYVVMNVRDKVNDMDLYNPDYTTKSDFINNEIKMISESDRMQSVIKLAQKISKTDATCLLTGESGTGKSFLAKYIHSISNRSDGPFVSINCACIPNELLESELFGYEKGAFTGAKTKGKEGLFQAAQNGTLLLDEISELSLPAQAKLLNVLQDRVYYPIGSIKPKKTNARIIATTNRDLKNMIKANTFREDLYYRINVFAMYIPPLRKRKKDIKFLVNYFLNHYCNKYDIQRQITDETMKILVDYQWKGNIRELSHVIERLVVTVDSLIIDSVHLPNNLFGIVDKENVLLDIEQEFNSLDKKIENYEKYIIINSYKEYDSSRKLADHLSISQSKANNLIRKYINNK